MRINVVCVGKIKEKFYTQAVEEYSKRLSRGTIFPSIDKPFIGEEAVKNAHTK